MNSNNDIENTRKVSARKWDELLDRYFSSVILPKVDTERVWKRRVSLAPSGTRD